MMNAVAIAIATVIAIEIAIAIASVLQFAFVRASVCWFSRLVVKGHWW